MNVHPGTAKPVEDPMLPLTYEVVGIKKELPDTVTLDLRAPDGMPFEFEPGQFNMLYAFGVGEIPISISGDTSDPMQLVHTIRVVGKVSQAFARLKEGDSIGVRGPYGVGWPVNNIKGSDVVIVGGGLGLAPLRPAIYSVLANRGQYGNVVILYGARTPNDLLFEDQLHEWRGRFDIHLDVIVDRAEAGWPGRVGVVTKLIDNAVFDPEETAALVCGPEIMMRYAVQALADRGVDTKNVYVSMERNMHCALGFCGHCQLGGTFVCRDGPVFAYDTISELFTTREA